MGNGRGGQEGEATGDGNENPGGSSRGRNRGRRKKMNKVLKIATLNARSLRNKKGELEILVKAQKLQIISVTETWGEEWISDGIFALKGCTMYRDDRDRIGGGTILYISDTIEQGVCEELNTRDVESSTWCWITEKMERKPW